MPDNGPCRAWWNWCTWPPSRADLSFWRCPAPGHLCKRSVTDTLLNCKSRSRLELPGCRKDLESRCSGCLIDWRGPPIGSAASCVTIVAMSASGTDQQQPAGDNAWLPNVGHRHNLIVVQLDLLPCRAAFRHGRERSP